MVSLLHVVDSLVHCKENIVGIILRRDGISTVMGSCDNLSCHLGLSN
jgi:hypothetical protein